MSACMVAAMRLSDMGPSAYGDENAKPGRLATTTWKSGSRSAKSSCRANVCGRLHHEERRGIRSLRPQVREVHVGIVDLGDELRMRS